MCSQFSSNLTFEKFEAQKKADKILSRNNPEFSKVNSLLNWLYHWLLSWFSRNSLRGPQNCCPRHWKIFSKVCSTVLVCSWLSNELSFQNLYVRKVPKVRVAPSQLSTHWRARTLPDAGLLARLLARTFSQSPTLCLSLGLSRSLSFSVSLCLSLSLSRSPSVSFYLFSLSLSTCAESQTWASLCHR